MTMTHKEALVKAARAYEEHGLPSDVARAALTKQEG